MPERPVCSARAWEFGRLEEIWAEFSPLTPFGKDAKEARAVMADRAAIERCYDDTEAVVAYLRVEDGPTLDRVAHHLRRIPRLSLGESGAEGTRRDAFDLVEIFQVKKFIANYRAVLGLLPDDLKARFGLTFESIDLAAKLDLGGSDAETFYIADRYREGLGRIRARIREVDAEAVARRGASEARAAREHGLDFAGRDFLVVPATRAHALLGVGFMVEAYDGSSCVVRLEPEEADLVLEEERDLLVDRERELESEVLAELSADIRSASEALRRASDALRDFDLARARAILTARYGLVRPRLDSEAFVVARGKFLPCVRECERLGLSYTPLDLRLAEGAAVLFGSNMGGKTVALQSLVFLQTLAQAGFHVPADCLATRVHGRIAYVGEARGEVKVEGLSGFGFEIRSFVDEYAAQRAETDGAAGVFLVLDEFARTTSSRDAEALLSAVIAALAAAPGVRCVLSTHFRGVARTDGVRYLRMRGLDRLAACEALEPGEALGERIKKINAMMMYEVVEDEDGGREGSDAIAIASLLGLDCDIVRDAEARYGSRPGNTRFTRGQHEG